MKNLEFIFNIFKTIELNYNLLPLFKLQRHAIKEYSFISNRTIK